MDMILLAGGAVCLAILLIYCRKRELSKTRFLYKRYEEQYDELTVKNLAIESAAEGIIITKSDGDHEILYCNKAYQRITGYSKEEILGRNPRFLQGPKTSQSTKDEIKSAIAKKHRIETEILNYTKDGRPFWNKASISPVYNSKGKVISFLGMMEDITPDVVMKTRLEESNRSLEEFAYIVSHDLKGPLRTIRVMADCLLEDAHDILAEESLEHLDRIHSSAQRMREMIDSLLIFSRVTKENHPHEEFDVVEVAREALQDLQKDDFLKLEVETDFPLIFANRIQIRSVFQNLFENSIKFYDKPNPVVKLSYETDSCYHIIKYEDNGIGFDMKYKDEVFKPFHKIYPEYEGTGMGMAICKKIIEKHRGMIEVESEIRVGTRFLIKLPRATCNHE